MEYLSEEEFEAILDKAIEDLPAGVTDELDNVALFVEDAPEDGSPTLLGLYDAHFYGIDDDRLHEIGWG